MKMKTLHLLMIIIISLLLLASVLFGVAELYVSQPVIPKGVTVSGLETGEKSGEYRGEEALQLPEPYPHSLHHIPHL